MKNGNGKFKNHAPAGAYRNFSFFILIFAFSVLIATAPLLISAAETGWEGIVPKCGTKAESLKDAKGEFTTTYTPCSTCDFAQLVKKFLDFLWKYAAVPGVALMLMVGGFQMITAALSGSGDGLTKGRKTITNAFFGLLIVLASWLAVDTIIKVIAARGSIVSDTPATLPQIEGRFQEGPLAEPSRVAFGPWNELRCTRLREVEVTTKPLPRPTPAGAGGAAGGAGGAACTQVTAGDCSVASLQSTFGTAATAASTICKAESDGISNRESTLDILPRSGNRPFSIGLFQINITANTFTCDGITLNCPSAFTGRNRDAIIVNEPLYNQCRQAPKNAFCNIQKAKALYDDRGGRWTDWRGTATNCGLPI